MKILVDAHVLDEAHQGTRTYIKEMYRELIAQMTEAEFYFASYDVENLRKEMGDFPNLKFLKFKQRKILRLLFEIPNMIRQHGIDYAHFQYVSSPLKNCAHIVTTHDILFRDFPELFPRKYRLVNDFLFKISARRADILLTVSDYSRQRIAFHYQIPIEKIGVTPNGVPEAFRLNEKSVSLDVKAKYNIGEFILYVSRIEPRKNHLLLLQAFLDLRLWEEGYSLVLIGKRDFLFADLDAFLDGCPDACKKKVFIIPNVDNSELLAFYQSARLFVYPSLAEGFGIPPIEAVSVGVQTLCSNTTAMSDFSFLGENLFNPSDIDEIRTKIKSKLLRPDGPLEKQHLKKVVIEKYSWSNAAKIFMSCVRKHQQALNHS